MTDKDSNLFKNTKNSKAFKLAEGKAKEYLNDSDKLKELVDEATTKADKKSGALSEIWGSVTALFRLIKAYANGSYRETPLHTILLIIASIIYFVMPLDFIPDFIVGFGYLDDIAILGWVISTFKDEIEKFRTWEKNSSQ